MALDLSVRSKYYKRSHRIRDQYYKQTAAQQKLNEVTKLSQETQTDSEYTKCICAKTVTTTSPVSQFSTTIGKSLSPSYPLSSKKIRLDADSRVNTTNPPAEKVYSHDFNKTQAAENWNAQQKRYTMFDPSLYTANLQGFYSAYPTINNLTYPNFASVYTPNAQECSSYAKLYPKRVPWDQSKVNESVLRRSSFSDSHLERSIHWGSPKQETDNSPKQQVPTTSSEANNERSQSEGDKTIVCRWLNCGDRFNTQDLLVKHVNQKHIETTKSSSEYVCLWESCPRQKKTFNARYKMQIHLRIHTFEKPHACHQCHKRFSRLENLKIHFRSHTGERPFACSYEDCGKRFSNSSDRFKHQRTHLVRKPYICKMPGCDKSYTDPSSLRKHVKSNGHAYKPNESALLPIGHPVINDNLNIARPVAFWLPSHSNEFDKQL